MKRKRRITIRRLLIGVVAVAALLVGFNAFFVHLVREKVYKRTLVFMDDSTIEAVSYLANQQRVVTDDFAPLEKPAPLTKVDAFGPDAWCWSNLFSQYGGHLDATPGSNSPKNRSRTSLYAAGRRQIDIRARSLNPNSRNVRNVSDRRTLPKKGICSRS